MVRKLLKKITNLTGHALLIASLLAPSIPAQSFAATSYIDRFSGSVLAAFGKQPTDVATTANIVLAGYQTIDGVSINADYMRVLVKNQTDSTKNGVYTVFSGNWIRSADFSGPSGTVFGQLVYATGGTQAGLWQLATPNPVQIDQSGGQATTPSNITFTSFFPQNIVSSINASVAAAAASATAAANSAALAGASLSATSTTSQTIGSGSFTFTTQANKNFSPGQFIVISSNANSANYMHGTVTSYSGTTLVFADLDNGGAGTFADWNISVSGPRGANGGGSGTVTSVSFTGDGTIFNSTVSGSPITSSGTLAPALLSKSAHAVLIGPTSSTAAPTFRSLAASDLPAATTSALGAVSTDGSTITNSSGAISCTTGTTGQLGCLRPDGTSITVSSGVISSTAGLPSASAITAPTNGTTVFTVPVDFSTYYAYDFTIKIIVSGASGVDLSGSTNNGSSYSLFSPTCLASSGSTTIVSTCASVFPGAGAGPNTWMLSGRMWQESLTGIIYYSYNGATPNGSPALGFGTLSVSSPINLLKFTVNNTYTYSTGGLFMFTPVIKR